VVRRDGVAVAVEMAAAAFADPGGSSVLVALRDVTDRRRAEERVREQAAVLDRVRESIVVQDMDDRVLLWNRGAERLYGWRRDEVLGQNGVRLLHAAQDPELAEAREQVRAHGEWTGELRQVTKAGRHLTVESHWTLERDERQQPKTALIISVDITDKKVL